GSVISGITNGAGIVITGTAAGNMIGGSLSGAGNKVAGVNGIGIGVQMLKLDNPLIPQKNAILGNSIRQIGIIDYPGFGESNQGIDIYKNFINNSGSVITKQGPNANNTTDPDGAPNNFMNYPVIKSATQNGAVVTISYDLDVSGSPNNQYRVEFFANDTATIFNYGPGETYLGAVTVPSGNNKISTINLQPGQVFNYKALTATATQLDNTITSGFGSTSEFSLNRTIGTNLDTDGDGASNITEDAAPNNGDADGDGIQDSLQSTVTSFMTDGVGGQPGTYISFNTSGCTDNGTVASIDPKTFAKQDAGYAYPFGYVNFSLKCSRGSTATITKYIYSDLDPKDFTLRKYRGDTQAYMEIEDADITRQVIAGKNAVKVVYGIADGGALDDDGTANGVIVDPVGLATKVGSKSASLGGLPSVGIATIYVLIPLLLAFLTTLAYVYRDYRKHKKPLVDENPDIEYTFLHHIQVVTLPILKYRLSIIVQPRGSA
ncbi:MAG: choice-of-anchor U domain-containing protein, partial [bacterium]